MDYLLAKQDLSTWPKKDIVTLSSYYNLSAADPDILWMLAILNMDNAKKVRASMGSQEFGKVLGAGGFGIVIKKHGSNEVGKFLINPRECSEAEIEYGKHLMVFNAFASVRSPKYSHICVSKPISFSDRPMEIGKRFYTCHYMMTELYPLNESGLYHVVSQQPQYEKTMNRIVGRAYNEPVSSSNPSRGFFATYSYIEKNILQKGGEFSDIHTVLKYMGYAFGVIFLIAELFPKDVEYVLGRNERGEICFTILDFGLTEPLSFINDDTAASWARAAIDDILDVDIYFPVDADTIEAFKEGFTDAYLAAPRTGPKKIAFQYIIDNWN